MDITLRPALASRGFVACARYVTTALARKEDTAPELDLTEPSDAVFRQIDEHVEAEYRKQVLGMYEHVLVGDLDGGGDPEQAAALAMVRDLRTRLSALVRTQIEADRAERPEQAGLDEPIERAVDQKLREIARELAEEALRAAGID